MGRTTLLMMKRRGRRSHRRAGMLPSHNPLLPLIILSPVWHQQIISEAAKQEAPRGADLGWMVTTTTAQAFTWSAEPRPADSRPDQLVPDQPN